MSQLYCMPGEDGALNTDLTRGLLSKTPIIHPAIPDLRMDEHPISINPELVELISHNAAVAIGISGGKDSQAAAIATIRYLDYVGHAGPRLLIHADLGSVEWNDSLRAYERLASFLGTELTIVRRKQGGLMERWESRWMSNVARYQQLSTVTLVPCWSTPRMRFCTSEAKTSPIQSALKRWSPHLPIISVTGVRRQESLQRGLGRDQAIELSRLCASRPDLNRVMLRLWRAFIFPELTASHGFRWAISYQDTHQHTGDLYRFDGWIVLGKSRSGTDSRSGRPGRQKVVWGWCEDEAERRLRDQRSQS